ncbi:MAG TPA: hypothetical protein ENK31_05905 [Nannocystis exedens]|nr:hypothetical protein [Nannocystis exedens]
MRSQGNAPGRCELVAMVSQECGATVMARFVSVDGRGAASSRMDQQQEDVSVQIVAESRSATVVARSA